MKNLLKHIAFIILSIIAGALVQCLMLGFEINAKTLSSVFTTSTTYVFAVVIYLVLVITMFLGRKPKEGKKGGGNEGRTATGDKLNEFADSRWVTEDELNVEAKFRWFYVKYSQLSSCKRDGIIIRNELMPNGKDFHINMYKPIHTLIVGTTGSGKTETFVFPALQIWPSCASKPSILVSDPKGELYGKTSNSCRKKGYNVLCIDLRNPYASKRWNPMLKSYREYHRGLNLEKEVKKIIGGKPDPKKYKLMNENYGNEWFAFNGVAYPNEQALKQDLEALRSELKVKAEKGLTDLAMSLCPITNKHDSSWEQGAQKFIEGVAVAMLEDSCDPSLGLTEEKFCPYNLAQIACYKDAGEDPFATLKQYFQGRPRDSKAMALASTALFNAPGTTKSYMGIATNALSLFQDMGINYLTSGTDIDLSRFAYDPTIIYFIVPDEDQTRHGLATIFIAQLYKQLIEEAVKCNPAEPELPKNVYFLLDEFANIPKIPDFAKLITVGRSRKIFFCMIIQSYSQLDTSYGEQEANTIRENCNIKIYIGTDDQKTKESFSKLCGDISIQIDKKSKSKDKSGKDSGVSESQETKQRPLIYPDELGHLPNDINLVKIFNEYPMKNKFTPSYNCKHIYDFSQKEEAYVPKSYFNTDIYYYDFKKRSKNNSNSDSDFSDLFS